ncbi:MAG: hypothetical protein ISEC1_P1074 [Thiomicrorhabdus sp.]|nr:MAG: hypothetical protein ISEC1_P1074 [Thiomicrorhabdus sp.]
MNDTQYKERRRYFRIPTNIAFHFIQSPDDIDQSNKSFIDFFTDDIGYTPYCFEDYIKSRKASFKIDIADYLSNKPEHKAVEDAFWTVSKKIKLFENSLKMISNGESPYNNRLFMTQFRKLSKEIPLDEILGNVKTKKILKNFDDKILYHLNIVDRVAENSTLDEIYSENFERDFDIEYDMISLKRIYKANHSVLAKLFILLHDQLEEIIRVFNDVVNGRTISGRPDLWSIRNINISAGGIGFNTNYRLEEGMILDVFFTLEGVKDPKGETIKMHKKVKVIHVEEQESTYYIGTMLLGAKSKEIDMLNAFVFNQEISQSMQFVSELPEDIWNDFDFLDLE